MVTIIEQHLDKANLTEATFPTFNDFHHTFVDLSEALIGHSKPILNVRLHTSDWLSLTFVATSESDGWIDVQYVGSAKTKVLGFYRGKSQDKNLSVAGRFRFAYGKSENQVIRNPNTDEVVYLTKDLSEVRKDGNWGHTYTVKLHNGDHVTLAFMAFDDQCGAIDIQYHGNGETSILDDNLQEAFGNANLYSFDFR